MRSGSHSITLLISIPGALFIALLNNLTDHSISFFITLLAYLRRAIHSSPAIFICEGLDTTTRGTWGHGTLDHSKSRYLFIRSFISFISIDIRKLLLVQTYLSTTLLYNKSPENFVPTYRLEDPCNRLLTSLTFSFREGHQGIYNSSADKPGNTVRPIGFTILCHNNQKHSQS